MPKLKEIQDRIELMNDSAATLTAEVASFPVLLAAARSEDENVADREEKFAEVTRLDQTWSQIIYDRGYDLIRGPQSLRAEDMLDWIEKNNDLFCILVSDAYINYKEGTPLGDMLRACQPAIDLAYRWIAAYGAEAAEPATENTAEELAENADMKELFQQVQDSYSDIFYTNEDLWNQFLPADMKPAAPKLNREQLDTAFDRMGEDLFESSFWENPDSDGEPDIRNLGANLRAMRYDLDERIELLAQEQYLTSMLEGVTDVKDQDELQKLSSYYPDLVERIEKKNKDESVTITFKGKGVLDGKSKEALSERVAEQKARYGTHYAALVDEECDRIERKYLEDHKLEALSEADQKEVVKLQNDRIEKISAEVDEKVLSLNGKLKIGDVQMARGQVDLLRSYNFVKGNLDRMGTLETRVQSVLAQEHNQDTFREQLYGVLQGPRSIESSDMMLWYTEHYRTLALLAVAFTHDLPVFDPETDKMLKESVTLAKNWQKQCCTEDFDAGLDQPIAMNHSSISLNKQVFAEDGTFLWDSPLNKHFKKDEAKGLFDKIQQNFAAYKDSEAMRPYKEAYEAKSRETTSAELALGTADGLLTGLRSFRNTLKKTDPIWLLTNSGNFKAMKDRISEAIRALKDFKKNPTNDKADAVRERMEALHTAVKTYHDAKEGSADSRGKRRVDITERFEEYLSDKLKYDFRKEMGAEDPEAKFTAQMKVVHDMYKGLQNGKIQWNDPKMLSTITDTLATLNGLSGDAAQEKRAVFAVEISNFNKLSMKDGQSFLTNPAFADIKKQLIALSKEGDQIAKTNAGRVANNTEKVKTAQTVKEDVKVDLIGS